MYLLLLVVVIIVFNEKPHLVWEQPENSGKRGERSPEHGVNNEDKPRLLHGLPDQRYTLPEFLGAFCLRVHVHMLFMYSNMFSLVRVFSRSRLRNGGGRNSGQHANQHH